MEPPTLNLPLNLKPLFLLHPPLIPRPLFGPLTETPYPPINRYRPINRLYKPLQDLSHPLYTTLHYTVWQTLVSKLVKVKRSGAKELTLRLQMMLTTIFNLNSLNTDTLSL